MNKSQKPQPKLLIPSTPWIRERSHLIARPSGEAMRDINKSLFLNKYGSWVFVDGKIVFNSYDKGTKDKINARRVYNLRNFLNSLSLDKETFDYLLTRRHSIPNKLLFSQTTKTRVIVNFGEESVFETNLALHPYWGFPIIPGSSLKGIFRHYCDDTHCITEEELLEICGNEPGDKDAFEGKVVFPDAWPEDYSQAKDALELDVMTPHYSKYYSDPQRHPPSDTQSPIPLQFLVVKKGISFKFLLLPSSVCDTPCDDLLKKVKTHLTAALANYGIGAKTGSGYGYFEEVR